MRTNFPTHAYRREDHTIVLRLGDDDSDSTVILQLVEPAAQQLRDEITQSLQEDRKWFRAGIAMVVVAVASTATILWTETKATPVGGYLIYTANLTGIMNVAQVVPAGALGWLGGFFLSRYRRRRR